MPRELRAAAQRAPVLAPPVDPGPVERRRLRRRLGRRGTRRHRRGRARGGFALHGERVDVDVHEGVVREVVLENHRRGRSRGGRRGRRRRRRMPRRQIRRASSGVHRRGGRWGERGSPARGGPVDADPARDRARVLALGFRVDAPRRGGGGCQEWRRVRDRARGRGVEAPRPRLGDGRAEELETRELLPVRAPRGGEHGRRRAARGTPRRGVVVRVHERHRSPPAPLAPVRCGRRAHPVTRRARLARSRLCRRLRGHHLRARVLGTRSRASESASAPVALVDPRGATCAWRVSYSNRSSVETLIAGGRALAPGLRCCEQIAPGETNRSPARGPSLEAWDRALSRHKRSREFRTTRGRP